MKLFFPPKTHRNMPNPAIHKLVQNIVSSNPRVIRMRFPKMRAFRPKMSPTTAMKNMPSKAPAYIKVMTRVSSPLSG